MTQNETVNEVLQGSRRRLPTTRITIRKVVSTGSTLLDLSISGGRTPEGGVPGGIILEIFGPSSSGKTAILAEICASVQSKGGEVKFQDPEARLDEEYCKVYGFSIQDQANYTRPDTVTEAFESIRDWEPQNPDVINIVGTDSLAALSTRLELDSGDKMGMRRAKEFSQELRKIARTVKNKNWVIACTNQVRDGDFGDITPGGRAVPFYSSLRINIRETRKIEKVVTLGSGRQTKKIIGIESTCKIVKSSVDDPFRVAPIYIIFNFGIDDIRGNLQYIKDMNKATKYDAITKQFQAIDKAITWIEDNNLEDELKKKTIQLWNEIEDKFKMNRKPKKR